MLHALALVGAFVVWPFVTPPTELPSDVVPIDLLTVADITNVAPQDKAEEEKPVEETPPEEPVPPEPAPQEQAALEPPPPPPEPEEPAPDAEPIKEEPKPEPPKPPEQRFALAEPRVKPKPEKKKEEFDLDKILKGLDSAPKETKAAPAKAAAERAIKGAGAQSALTASEIDALKARLAKCWNVPVGAPDPTALVFRVRVFLNEDGTVASPPQLVDKGNLGDPYFRAAADSAIRAIQICGPYDLPPQKYADWQDITIEFDPTKMAGY
jgi:outer membrane biosynthesis protein TonB